MINMKSASLLLRQRRDNSAKGGVSKMIFLIVFYFKAKEYLRMCKG